MADPESTRNAHPRPDPGSADVRRPGSPPSIIRHRGLATPSSGRPANGPVAAVWECPAAQAGGTAEDDEGVIQQYMVRLLQRIAGTAPAEQASVEHGSSTTPGPTHAGDDRLDPVDSPRAEAAPERAADAKPAAPAMVADLLAMRELANRSTRA